MILLDTNLLVYAHRAATPEHEAAKEAIERAIDSPRGAAVALGSVAELFAIATHPKAQGRPSSAQEVAAFLDALVGTGGVRILEPAPGHHRRLLEAAEALGVSGARIFDLQIALTGREHGARRVWTHDRRFVSVPGLKVEDPLDG